MSSDLRLWNGRLVVRGVRRLGEVELADFKSGDRRLVLVVDVGEVQDDPILHYIFSTTLPHSGHLALVPPDLEHLVGDLIEAGRVAADWLVGTPVTVAVVAPVPVRFVAACILVAQGIRAPAAIDMVGGNFEIDDEIGVSVYEAALRPTAAGRV
jgi:hypothetical protein